MKRAMSPLPDRVRVTSLPSGERWWLGAGVGGWAVLIAAAAVLTALGVAAEVAADRHLAAAFDLSIAFVCGYLAIALRNAGVLIDPRGVTGLGVVRRRRLRFADVEVFEPRGAVRLLDGRTVVLPGARMRGRRTRAQLADALNERLAAARP